MSAPVALAAGLASQMSWTPSRTVGGVIVTVGMAVLAVRVARAPRVMLLLALPAAYLGRRIGLTTGFIKWVDHHLLERVNEEFDNVDTWLVAFAIAVIVLAVARARASRSRG